MRARGSAHSRLRPRSVLASWFDLSRIQSGERVGDLHIPSRQATSYWVPDFSESPVGRRIVRWKTMFLSREWLRRGYPVRDQEAASSDTPAHEVRGRGAAVGRASNSNFLRRCVVAPTPSSVKSLSSVLRVLVDLEYPPGLAQHNL
jgi:hypothetical protein